MTFALADHPLSLFMGNVSICSVISHAQEGQVDGLSRGKGIFV